MYGKINNYYRVNAVSTGFKFNKRQRKNDKNESKKFADILNEKTGEDEQDQNKDKLVDLKY
ncbi:hypothetical protein ACFL7D_04280 [candidate division KSB1 bacterium]